VSLAGAVQVRVAVVLDVAVAVKPDGAAIVAAAKELPPLARDALSRPAVPPITVSDRATADTARTIPAASRGRFSSQLQTNVEVELHC
jgi:hypothetical protein